MRRFYSAALFFLLMLTLGSVQAADTRSILGQKAPELQLSDFRGAQWSLEQYADKKVIVVAFMGVECPIVKLYAERLVHMQQELADQGVGFVAINSNQQDSITEIAHFARVNKIDFPILKDAGNKLADAFAAERTPEIFVLDQERVVRYHGRIDDQYTYGVQRPKVEHDYLHEAIASLLAGEPVKIAETEIVGCHIGRVFVSQENSEVTYSNQISRILQKRCVECHREGEMRPFSLTSYDEVVGWAEMIDEVVQLQRMPPWHANPDYGHFINDVRLSDEEKSQIKKWVAAGAPEGDPQQLPPPAEYTAGWRIGEPDLVLKMRDEPFQVPATGEVKYQYFIVDPGFTEDKWVKAAECRIGNRAVVHHVIVAAIPPGGREAVHGDLDSDWLVATAPGARPLMLRPGMAKKIPAGSKLAFQVHYTPNGTAQEDLSSVGLVFADPATVKQEVATQKAATRNFEIPAGDGNYRVDAAHTFAKNSQILAMFPHMHLRGKSFRYTALYPDGTSEILLDVPHYDFNWQNGYAPQEPKFMPAGTKLHCTAYFDNSEENLANPDPTQSVRWGDQTWEEMMIGYFDMALADQDLTKEKPAPTRVERFLSNLGDGAIEPKLAEAARRALESEAEMNVFGAALKKVAPQLDRVCWTARDGDKVRVEMAAQEPVLRLLAGGRGLSFKAQGMGLTAAAESDKPTVHQDLAKAEGEDLKLVSRALGSSFHVPVQIDGRAGTINFWSGDKQAFPPEAAAWLEKLAAEMKKGRE